MVLAFFSIFIRATFQEMLLLSWVQLAWIEAQVTISSFHIFCEHINHQTWRNVRLKTGRQASQWLPLINMLFNACQSSSKSIGTGIIGRSPMSLYSTPSRHQLLYISVSFSFSSLLLFSLFSLFLSYPNRNNQYASCARIIHQLQFTNDSTDDRHCSTTTKQFITIKQSDWAIGQQVRAHPKRLGCNKIAGMLQVDIMCTSLNS